MKFRISLLILLLLFAVISCKNDSPNITNTNEKSTGGRLSKPWEPVTPVFGILKLALPGNDVTMISQNGPTGNGWNGISIGCNANEINAAKAAGYYPIVADLWLDEYYSTHQLTWVNSQIALGKSLGVDWFYIDDGCSSGRLSVDDINIIAGLVHAAPSKPLATSEYSQNALVVRPDWHNNVDIIMPYNYALSPTQLQSFFQFVKTNYVIAKYKELVPILGYYADIWADPPFNPPQYFPNQKGSASGDQNYIEIARNFTTRGIVFYYHAWYTLSWDPMYLTKANELTNYLQNYYAMGGLF